MDTQSVLSPGQWTERIGDLMHLDLMHSWFRVPKNLRSLSFMASNRPGWVWVEGHQSWPFCIYRQLVLPIAKIRNMTRPWAIGGSSLCDYTTERWCWRELPPSAPGFAESPHGLNPKSNYTLSRQDSTIKFNYSVTLKCWTSVIIWPRRIAMRAKGSLRPVPSLAAPSLLREPVACTTGQAHAA